jgi:predicted DCC family thiol-disulfide oxidoreductase YuxK
MGAPAPVSNTPHPIILFDGVCNLCNGAVQFIIKRDPDGVFRFASLQSEQAQKLLSHLKYSSTVIDSILLVDNGIVFSHSDAAIRIASRLNGGWKYVSVFKWLPKSLRDGLYKLVANNRYRFFGKREVCMLPSAELKSRFL